MRRPNELRLPGGVAERLANFSDQACQVGLGDKRRRPQLFVQLVLRQRARPMLHQGFQELERLGGQMNLLAAPQELPGVGVQRQLAKPEFHRSPIERSLDLSRDGCGNDHRKPIDFTELPNDSGRGRLHINDEEITRMKRLTLAVCFACLAGSASRFTRDKWSRQLSARMMSPASRVAMAAAAAVCLKSLHLAMGRWEST